MNNVNEHRTYSISNAREFLKNIIHVEIEKKYSCVNKFVLNDSSCDSGVSYVCSDDILVRERSHPKMKCEIGIKELYDGQDENNMVRNIDFIWVVKHIFHEAHHLHLMQNVYQNKLSGRDLDSARIDAILCLFDGYKNQMYQYAPSEIDSDIQGFESAVKWSKENVPIIDVEACFVAKVQDFLNWRGSRSKSIYSYDALLTSLYNMKDQYKYQPRDNVFNKSDIDTITFIKKQCPKWLSEIEKIQNGDIKDYIEADRLLFSVALDVNSFWIDHHAGLDNEVKAVRKIYPSKLKIGSKIVSDTARFLNMQDIDTIVDLNDDQTDDEFLP